jgi:hypothetical protein
MIVSIIEKVSERFGLKAQLREQATISNFYFLRLRLTYVPVGINFYQVPAPAHLVWYAVSRSDDDHEEAIAKKKLVLLPSAQYGGGARGEGCGHTSGPRGMACSRGGASPILRHP